VARLIRKNLLRVGGDIVGVGTHPFVVVGITPHIRRAGKRRNESDGKN
jgi:hypothetical protein